jgi:GH15 family glucan-1,4-alpha-glucosidase
LGDAGWAERLRRKIDSEFWSDALGYYVDYRGAETFDTLGNSLAIFFGLVSDSRIESILKGLNGTLCNYGYRNLWPPYTKSSCGRTPGTYQNGGVWPFVQGYAVLALKKAHQLGPAHDEVRRMSKFAGFNEWYEPSSGLPRGSRSQLWSAAMFLEAVHGLSPEQAPSSSAGGHVIG